MGNYWLTEVDKDNERCEQLAEFATALLAQMVRAGLIHKIDAEMLSRKYEIPPLHGVHREKY
jgi:hypothetical protein